MAMEAQLVDIKGFLKSSRVLFITQMIAYTAVVAYTASIWGANQGYNIGVQTGEANALMKSAGKCFKHIEREIR